MFGAGCTQGPCTQQYIPQVTDVWSRLRRPNQLLIQKQIFLGTLSVPTTMDHSQKGKSQRDSDPPHPHSEKSEVSFVPLPPSFLLSRSSEVLEWPLNQITKTWFVRRPEWWLISNLRTNMGHSQIFSGNTVRSSCVRTARKLQGSGCLQAGGEVP